MKTPTSRRAYLGAGVAAFILLTTFLNSRLLFGTNPTGLSNGDGGTGTFSSSAGSDAHRWSASLAGCVVLALAAFPRHRACSTFSRSPQP